eukprot:3309461-Alexandrium_andersonii.AAC.1
MCIRDSPSTAIAPPPPGGAELSPPLGVSRPRPTAGVRGGAGRHPLVAPSPRVEVAVPTAPPWRGWRGS